MLKVATVCTGIGSPEYALKEMGIEHEVVFGCEIDKYARATYLENFTPKMMFEDMTNGEIDNHYADLIIGGIPCQSFSLAGKRLGELDPRGLLFYNFYEYVKIQKPKYFIIENVKGLLSTENVFETRLELLGQSVNNQHNMFNHEDIFNTLDANYHKGMDNHGQRSFILEPPQIDVLGNVGNGHEAQNVYNKDGIAPCVREMHGKVIKVVVDEPKIIGYTRDADGKVIARHLKDEAGTIHTSSGSGGNTDQFVLEPAIINPLKDKTEYGWHFEQNVYDADGICRSLKSSEGSGNIPKVIEPAILSPQRTEFGKETRKEYMAGNLKLDRSEIQSLVPRTDGISNTISTVQKDNLLFEPFCVAMRGRTENKGEDWHNSNHVQKLEKRDDGVTNTISSIQKDNLIVEPGTLIVREVRTEEAKKQRRETGSNDFRDKTIEFIESDVANCIQTGLTKDNLIVVGNLPGHEQDGRIYSEEGLAPTLDTKCSKRPNIQINELIKVASIYNSDEGISTTIKSEGGGLGAKTGLYETRNRIRRLTPRECGRLQGFSDDFKQPVSDTQKYRQYGNTISTSVIKAILVNLLK